MTAHMLTFKPDRALIPAHISPRERDVLIYIAEGQTTKGIALIMKLSPKTVEYHRAQLMQRTRVFDVAGLTRLAIKWGLVSVDGKPIPQFPRKEELRAP